MNNSFRTFAGLALALAVFTGPLSAAEPAAPAAEALPPLLPDPNEPFYGARIQRTMTLLATSSPQLRRKVKILAYGQSIVAQAWSGKLAELLQEKYPDAIVEFSNRAIGGFGAASLVRTAWYDLYQEYPDLVIFHVYGGEWSGELERIFYNLRKYTTAEILTYTHHLDRQEKLERVERSGATASAKITEYLAQKYNCELVDVRRDWTAYLRHYGMEPVELLRDSVHLNDKGIELMTRLVWRHFKYTTLFNSDWSRLVRDYEARRLVEEGADEIQLSGDGWEVRDGGMVSTRKGDRLTLKFRGNRVDVIDLALKDREAKLGSARVLIDGRAPSEFPGVYYVERPSTAHKLWWPALRRVTLHGKPVMESWEMTIREVNADSSNFKFSVTGSVTGPDGEGTAAEKFVSNSGQFSILPWDFSAVQDAARVSKEQCPENFKVTWKIGRRCCDLWQPVAADPHIESTTLLAQGIDNTEHTLELIAEGDGLLPLKGIRVYTPPLP